MTAPFYETRTRQMRRCERVVTIQELLPSDAGFAEYGCYRIARMDLQENGWCPTHAEGAAFLVVAKSVMVRLLNEEKVAR